MKPVDQTISSPVNGNCFEACVASILELSIEDVPAFVDGNPEEWFENFSRWAATRGYVAAYLPNDPPIAPMGYHVGSCDVHQHNGIRVAHAIVALNGVTTHCPHPTRAGFNHSVRYWTLLLPIGEPVLVELAL